MDEEVEIDLTQGPRRVDVRLSRRPLFYDLDDLAEAMAMLRRKLGPGVEVTIIQPDGYKERART